MSAFVTNEAHVSILTFDKCRHGFFRRAAKALIPDKSRRVLASAQKKRCTLSCNQATTVFTGQERGDRERFGMRISANRGNHREEERTTPIASSRRYIASQHDLT